MQLFTIADITPGGTATPLTSVKGTLAVWVTLTAAKGNANPIRVGDSKVSATRGAAVNAGDINPIYLPRCDFTQQGYDLSKVFVFGSGSDSVSITYGQ